MAKAFLFFLLVLTTLAFLSLPSSDAKIWPFSGGNQRPDLSDVFGRTEFYPARVKQVSWKPRAFLYKGFLSHQECDHLISLAKANLEQSMVVDSQTGKSIPSSVRTSSGFFLQKHQDEVVTRIERRIAAWTFLPEANGETIHVLRYQKGQKYEAHFDYFADKINQEKGGHRFATVLMYLADVQRGGETVFPNAEGKHLQPKDDTWTDCAKAGFAVKPRKGDTVLFFSLFPNATTDTRSLHASCPVEEGEKWSATKWIHVRNYDLRAKQPRPSADECVDENDECEKWAAKGECDKNPVYMVGSDKSLGYCRKSCKVCSSSASS